MADRTISDATLLEYQICHEDVREFGNRIWQIAGVVLVFSLGGIVLVAGRTEHDASDVVLTGAVALFSAGVIWLWFAVYSRLRLLYVITYHRIHEIERTLNLKKNVYVDVVDNWSQEDNPNRLALSPDELAALESLARRGQRLPRVTHSVVALAVGGTVAWAGVFVWDLLFAIYG